MILENLRMAGVQEAHKEDRISFGSLAPWPRCMVCAESRHLEGEGGDVAASERRAAIFIGPEFGTVSRPDLVEAGDLKTTKHGDHNAHRCRCGPWGMDPERGGDDEDGGEGRLGSIHREPGQSFEPCLSGC